jgi:hypothetical protein
MILQAAIYRHDGPIDPAFMTQAIRDLLRALLLRSNEPAAQTNCRMVAGLTTLAALNPRDEAEVMLASHAVAAHHAAMSLWWVSVQKHLAGTSPRFVSAAAAAARGFVAILQALEKRQATKLREPDPPPPPRFWGQPEDPTAVIDTLAKRCAPPDHTGILQFTTEQAEAIKRHVAQERFEDENWGLDLANTEGILPGGGMIVPPNPTPQQEAYLARRYAMKIQRMYQDNLKKGSTALPIPPNIRIGDLLE